MVVGIWCGDSKPVLDEYLLPFVLELETILETGIFVNGCHIKIAFGKMILDIPARAIMKSEFFE